MRTPFHQHGYVALRKSESFGRIKAYKLASAVSGTQLRSEANAAALRVFAANGFGDAAIGRVEPVDALNSVELYHRARAHRSYHVAQTVSAMLQASADAGRRMLARWKRWSEARATYMALRQLDARTLRDLGFDRSELLSIAAEISGRADSSRVRSLQVARA